MSHGLNVSSRQQQAVVGRGYDVRLFEVKSCRHQVDPRELRDHVVKKSLVFEFPLKCPVCLRGEITFEEAEKLLSPNEMTALNRNFAESVRRSFVFECCICLVEQPIEDVFHVPACGHKICRQDAQMHVKTQCENGRFPLTCPACPQELPPDLAETVLDLDGITKMRRDAFNKATAGDVHCPKLNCSGVAEVVAPSVNFICPVCHYQMCTKCRKDWHSQQISCEAAEKNRQLHEAEAKADAAFEAFRQREKLQKCPNCRAVVERISNCNHVVCRCGTGLCCLCAKIIPTATHDSSWTHGGHTCPLWPR